MIYDLELDKVVKKIGKSKLVCIQLPDGLKSEADNIVDYLEEKTNAKVIIWAGNCYGACDIPSGLRLIGVEKLFCFGHNRFNKVEGW
ncbi:diphthamide synthesis protein [archaeon]|nr:diphthamide synthesis protein [archaeon]